MQVGNSVLLVVIAEVALDFFNGGWSREMLLPDGCTAVPENSIMAS